MNPGERAEGSDWSYYLDRLEENVGRPGRTTSGKVIRDHVESLQAEVRTLREENEAARYALQEFMKEAARQLAAAIKDQGQEDPING